MAPRTALVALVALANPEEAGAVARHLAADGVHVAVLGDTVAGAELALGVGGSPSTGDVAEALDRIERALGPIGTLVCEAVSPPPVRFADADPAEWFAGVRAALTAPFRLVRAAVPLLERTPDARIILVGAGWNAATPGATAAAAVQGALVAFVKTLARDLGPRGIIVNEVAVPPAASPAPAALASAVGYLVSPAGSATVGQVLTVGRGGELRP